MVGTDPAVTSGFLEQQTNFLPSQRVDCRTLCRRARSRPSPRTSTNAVTWLLADGSGNLNGTSNTSGPSGPGGPSNSTYTYTCR